MQIDLTLRYQCRADCVHFRFNRRGKLLTGVCLKKKIKIKKRSLQLPRSSRLHLFKHLFLYKQQRSWSFFLKCFQSKRNHFTPRLRSRVKESLAFQLGRRQPPDKKKKWLLLWIFYFSLTFSFDCFSTLSVSEISATQPISMKVNDISFLVLDALKYFI